MRFNVQTAAAVAFAFSTLGKAHLMLMRPVPYGINSLNKSPLVDVAPGSSTSDYPCKLRKGVYDIAVMNNFTVGQPQELSFIGSVSHGGGTCQLAMTKDKEPTATSVFKVFQVFEGGCPVNSNGNTGTHPFTFVLPKDMPNGVMTFAWIWYNRIGDREIYMNCAPATVSGGSNDDTYFNSLPNAYIINLPTTECQSSFQEESNGVTIPHPGQYILTSFEGQQMHAATGPNCTKKAEAMLEGVVGYQSNVVKNNGAAYTFKGKLPPVPHASGSVVPAAPASASAGGAAGLAGGASSPAGAASGSPASASAPTGSAAASASSAGAGSPSTAAGASGSAAPSNNSGAAPLVSATSEPLGSSGGGASPPATDGSAFPSLTATGSAGVAPSSGAIPTGAAGSGSAAAPSAAAPSAAPSGGTCSGSSAAMTCSSDGKQFGVCDNGKMVWRAVAPGTTCKNGQITKRDGLRNRRARRQLHREYVVEVIV